MPDVNRPLPKIVAAVDLGSNSFHLVLARVSDGQLVVIDRLREMVQLASGLDRSKRLSQEAIDRALDCLGRFGQRLRHVPGGAVRAVGTNTLRTARNSAAFLTLAEEALGHPIETISGIEEARLIYLGVSHSVADTKGKRLVIDIGGGSTELIIGEGFQPLSMESLYLGSVTASREHFADGEINAKNWERAELAAYQEFKPIEPRFRATGWDHVVGSSGTIRAVGQAVRELGLGTGEITARSVRRLRDAMLDLGHVKKLKLESVSARRRRYFPGGVAVLLTLIETFSIDRVSVSDGALREGVLYDLLGRIREEDVRGRTVAALADRGHVDWRQAERVERTALRILDSVAADWKLAGPVPRNLLSWSARLHEIGLDIAHSHYQKHGEYIIAMADLPGFSFQEQKLLAVLVRAHRRKFPTAVIKEVPGKWSRTIERLAIVLRIAVLMHHGRSPEPLPEIQYVPGKRQLQIRPPEGWLESQPLSRADLEREANYLKALGFKLTFG